MLANNIAPHNAKIKTYIKDITPVIALKPDAMIMSDPGMIMLVREHFQIKKYIYQYKPML